MVQNFKKQCARRNNVHTKCYLNNNRPFGATGDIMKLKQYIEEHHGGNVTAYARSYGTTKQQMQKWLKLDCRVIEGIIYRPVAKHKK